MDVQKLLGRVTQHLSVSRAFGTAYEKDGSLVIPVALVASGGGGGEGTSGPPASASSKDGEFETGDHATNDVSPSGSGGGFGGLVIPAGVYVVRGERVRWVPAVNANLVIVVAFMTLRIMARARRKARRRNS